MIPAQLVYDPATDQLVVRVAAADGEGDVELLRLDVKQLSTDDKRRLSNVRDPKQAQPAPGDLPVTRR
jgi:hypothetical protein